MDNFLSQIKKNITSSIQNTSQTFGGIFGKSQQTASSLVRSGSEKIQDILKPLEKLKPEQYDIAIPGPTTGSYKPFKNLYVEAAAQTLGLGARDTDVLERLPSATIGALKGAGDGLAQALTFGWWNPEIKYANDVEKMAGDMTEVEFNVLGTIGTFVVGGGLVQGALKGVPLLGRVATVAPRTFSLLSNGLTFAGLTQLQKEESYKDAQQRAKDFVSDFALGGAFSIAGMKPSFLKSSAIIGPATYVTSLIKGDSNEDALKNTAAMIGLHSLNFAVAKYLPNKSAVESQIEKAASEQLKITKKQALEYLGVNEKATVEQVKQAWKNKVVGITKEFPAQAKQTPQEMGRFNQAWNTANRAYEFLAKVSNPTGYTGKSFRQEFQDLYYDLWKNVPDKRAIIIRAVRNMPAGLSIRATLNDAQRSEIVTALGGQEAKTRLGRVAELTDADLVTVAMENKIPVIPSKTVVEKQEIYSLPGDLEPARGKPTWKHGKMLWNTMRNQYGQTNHYSRDVTVNKGVVSWIIDTLENGLESKKILMDEAKKFQGKAMETAQYKKLYAMFKNQSYDIDGYRKVMATLKGIKPAIIEKTVEVAAKVTPQIQPAVSTSEKPIQTKIQKAVDEAFEHIPDWIKQRHPSVEAGKQILQEGYERGLTLAKKAGEILPNMPVISYHGTTRVNAEAIQKSGFKVPESETFLESGGRKYGEGVYLQPGNKNAMSGALFYGKRADPTGMGANLAIIETEFTPKNPFVISVPEKFMGFGSNEWGKFIHKILKKTSLDQSINTYVKDKAARLLVDAALRKAGYDSVILKTAGEADLLVALNPKDVKVVKVYSDKDGFLETFRRGYDKAFRDQGIAITSPTTQPTDTKISKIVEKLSSQEKVAVKAAEIRDKYKKPEEIELEQAEQALDANEVLNAPTFKERQSGNVVDLPPGEPPRPPQETPIESDPPPPDGSALSQIDAMVGKLSPAANLLDKAKKAIQVFPRLFTDRFAPIREFENKVSKLQGKPIDIDSSPYVGARMYAGRFGIVEGNFRDLYTALQPVRKLRADFTRYVLAQRTAERAARGVENPLEVTQETAEKALQELKAKVGDKTFQTFQQVGNGMQNWAVKAILEPMKDTGILSNKAFNAVVEKNKNWLPFHVLEYIPTLEEADKMAVGSETFSVSKQGVVSALEGTDKVIRDPFISVIDNLTKAVSLVERNKVALKLVELRKTHPDATKGLIRFLPNKENAPQDWESISVFIGGKVTRWAVPKELSEAMHAMSPAESGLMGKLVMMSSKAFKAGTTTLYFPFTLSNAVRDYQTATMISKYGFNPAVWLSGFKDGFRSAFKWESKAYDEFMRNQGGYGSYIESTKGLAVASEQLFRPRWMERTKAVLNPFELIGNFSEAIELAPRLGIYKKALSKGATPLEAAFEARNVTVDFAKAGVEARLINMWVPFVNARWQGLLNVTRVMKDNPVRTAARALAMTVLPGIATYFYNVMNHEELWDDIPQWAKDTYFIIIVGEDKEEDGNRVPKVIQIPKGDVGTIFFNPLMYSFEYVRKQEPQNLFKLGLEWMSQLAPVPFTRDGELSSQAFFSGALPPIIRTPLEIATNTNFFTGFPVVPRKLEKVAPSEQYDSRTPDLAVTIGRALGVSPMKLTHAVYGLTGSLARELLSPADVLGLTMDRFYRTQGGEKQRRAWDIKYDAEVGYNTTRLQMKKLVEEGNLQEAQQMALRWNAEAEKLIPQVVPLLMKDDPKEASLFQSSITFNASDLQRLLKTTLPGGIPQETDSDEQKSTLVPLKNGPNSTDNQSIKSLIYR